MAPTNPWDTAPAAAHSAPMGPLACRPMVEPGPKEVSLPMSCLPASSKNLSWA